MSKFLVKLQQKSAQFDSWWDSNVEPKLQTEATNFLLWFVIGAIVTFVVLKTIF